MSEVMVVERSSKLKQIPSNDPATALKAVYRHFFFVDEREAARERSWLLVISTKSAKPGSKPEPVSRVDFWKDALNPVVAKAKSCAPNGRALIKRVQLSAGSLVFVYSSSSSSSARR